MLRTEDVRDPTVRRPGAGHLLAPLLAGVLAALGTLATIHVFVRTISGQWLDTAAMLGTDVHHARVEQLLSRTLDATTLTSLVLVCVVAAAVGVIRRRPDLALAAAVLVLAANGTTQILKDRLQRPPFDGLDYPNSLPSGHTTAAASVAFALVLVLPEAVRGTAALAGAGYTAVIAIGTVWARWHRPSDAIAALLIVLGWGAFVVLVDRLLRWRRRTRPGRPSRLTTLPLLVTAAVTTPVTVLGLLLGKTSEAMVTTPEPSRLTFLTGAAGIAAVVSIAFLVWLWLAADNRPAAGPDAARE
ncbi:phosphatase PAP2 family protein [Actinoplanes sp. DH11]|uniref:phosphatase PAP2 family protein n=1 Tax=Actinoplanes sp. DH11 TaxID=2857011 RepID=UPI001E38C2A3|nr:phosphatase PAP2 family protein [Actinoplanes sp. DH11]